MYHGIRPGLAGDIGPGLGAAGDLSVEHLSMLSAVFRPVIASCISFQLSGPEPVLGDESVRCRRMSRVGEGRGRTRGYGGLKAADLNRRRSRGEGIARVCRGFPAPLPLAPARRFCSVPTLFFDRLLPLTRKLSLVNVHAG